MFRLIRAFLVLAVFPAVAFGQLRITEFVAANTRTLADEDGAFEDWIEIHNASVTTVNLEGWCLTDSASDMTQWRFPATNLNAGAYLVVFASNKNRRVPGRRLHTNFKLSASGEYLALVHPDGVTVATEFTPAFPSQVADVSYGFGLLTLNATLLGPNAPARVLIPSGANGGDALALNWTGAATNEPFADAAWRGAVTGIGFSAGANLVASTSLVVRFNFDAAPVANAIVDSKPVGAAHNGVNKGAAWVAASTDAAPTPVTRGGAMQFDANAGSQITLAAHTDFNATNGTIMFWMRTAGATGPGNYGPILFDRRANQYTGPGDVIVMQDDGRVFVQAGNGASGGINQFATPNAVNDNRWHHIAYVYDQTAAGFIAVYIDGVLSRQQNNSAAWSWSATQEIELGRSYDPFWRRFNGLMDDFRIYNRRLTAMEIAGVFSGDGGVAPGDIGTNIQAEMLNTSASAFLRVPFVVNNPAEYSLLTLRLKYDDGFVAWINGHEVSRGNAPADLTWNSAATGAHSSSIADTITIGNPTAILRAGTNILAIQGLNTSASDPNFLVLPELTATSFGQETANGVYFTSPTPGAPNSGGASTPGPAIVEVAHSPNPPLDNDDLLVTAHIEPTFYAVSNVTLRYRVMFNSEVSVTMFDDGAHGDGAAGDGIFGASIPASASTSGQMIRYYVAASDIRTNRTRWPLFTDPANTAEYLGTVVNPDYVTSQIPIFHLFIAPANQSGVDGESGSRVSFFYDGEFYDNVYMELRGNTTAGYPKKSHRLEFNREHPLRHAGAGGRVRKTSLMAEFIDPSYVRQFLSFWLLDQAGHNAPFHYPVRVQRNGQFYQLAYHSESLGEEQLARFGFDPNGALYKAVGVLAVSPCSTGGGPEKRTRDFEPGIADYTALASAIANTLPLAQRRTNLFDIIDVPDLINYLAVSRLTHEQDDIWANLCVYRDSDGDRLWRVVPFDMNLSWGQLYGGSTIQAANDGGVSHPFYGASTVQIGGACGGFNHLFDAVVQIPATRQMFLRRLRSVMDQFLQPPGTPALTGVLENKIFAMTNQIWAEAFLDRQTWNWATGGGPGALPPVYLANGITDLINQFINPRRAHLYRTHSITNNARAIGLTVTSNAGIPLSQPPDAGVAIAGVEFNPPSGKQVQEYICVTNPNPFAIDISGWNISGAVRFTFKAGAVIPSNSLAYVSPDVSAFRTRANGPRGGQGLFVVGPYQGQLSAWGETLTISDDHGRIVQEFSYTGNPTLAQQFLRVTEIMFHPAPLAGNTNGPEEFEFVELRNISTNETLDLAGIHFTNGIEFTFTGSAVTSLAPGARVLVVKNAAAFTARYGGGLPVAGTYVGSLDNAGEAIRLDDAVGEKILDFSYNNSWYPITDGTGYSLVIVDENAPWNLWGDKASWRASAAIHGSPGGGDPADPSNFLWIDQISPGVTLTFQAASNKTYTVEFTENLGMAWQTLTNLPVRVTNWTGQITNAATGVRRYYRLTTP